jgi:hypothetical protein
MEARVTPSDRFRRGYVPGFDCRLSTLRNTLAYHGHPFSNGMVLGLSGALCFSYADSARNRLPFHTVAGVSDQTLEGTAAALNLYMHRGRHDPAHAGPALFREYLAEGIPVNTAVYRPALKRAQFRGRPVRISDATAVGFHYVTLTEYDADAGEYTVFETDAAAPFRVTEDELMAAWFHDRDHHRPLRDPFQPCDGHWYALNAPKSVEALLPASIRHAAAKVVHGFFAPPVDRMGRPALQRLAADAAEWHTDAWDEAALAQSIVFMKILEHWLTGGGFGRKLYGRFLSESATVADAPELKGVARQFAGTAAAWSALVTELNAAVKCDWSTRVFTADRAKLRDAARALPTLVDLETAQMEALGKWAS